MNMKNILMAGLLATLPVLAQDPGLVVSAGLMNAQGDAAILTQKHWNGLVAEVGYGLRPEGYGVGLMPYLGVGRMGGEKNLAGRTVDNIYGPNSYNLLDKYAGLDIQVKVTESLPLTFSFGPQVHYWKVSRIQGSEADMGDSNKMKLGWRFGLDYTFSKRWSVVLAYTQSEYLSNKQHTTWPGVGDEDDTNFINGLNPSRPSYLSLMARYRF